MAQARMRFLTDDEKDLIHEQTLRVLEQAGIAYNLPEAIDLLAAAGAQVDRQTLRARVPRELVAAALQTVPRRVLLAARDPRRDVVLGDGSLTYLQRRHGDLHDRRRDRRAPPVLGGRPARRHASPRRAARRSTMCGPRSRRAISIPSRPISRSS